jgi:acyl carrier protein
MTQTEILDQLRKQLVTGVFIKKGVELNMDTRFGEDLGLDSMDIVELSLIIEHQWKVDLPLDAFDQNIQTIGDVVRLLVDHVK